MKKIYSLLAMSAFAGSMFAQGQYANKAVLINSVPVQKSEATLKVINDTTGWTTSGMFAPEFAASSGQATNYGYSTGGSVYGSNNDSLNVCAQGYENSNQLNFSIAEVIGWFYRKDSVGGGSFEVQVYQMAENAAFTHDGTNWVPNSAEGPSLLLGGQPFTLSDVDTASTLVFSSFPFSSPISVNGTNFAIGIDASAFISTGDTIGLVSDSDGDGMRYAFHRIGNAWAVTQDLFGGNLDNNIALFAVVSDANVGINSNEYFNGVQMSAFPNPVVNNTTISFGLEKAFDNVRIEVLDSRGRVVANINKGAMAPGVYNEVIDFSAFAAGKYYYSVITNESRLTKKLVVTK